MAGTNPFGLGVLGRERFGDQQAGGTLPRSTAMGLSFTVAASKYSVPMGLTYTLQANNVAILQLYYLIAPPTQFAINGDASIISPDQVTYTPRQVAARDLLGNPLFGGYAGVTWTYTLLQQVEAQYLLAFYNPVSPVVTLTYPSEDGLWVQRRASMLPPNYGSWETISVTGLTLTFLLLPN
jgi:hypothetical protein